MGCSASIGITDVEKFSAIPTKESLDEKVVNRQQKRRQKRMKGSKDSTPHRNLKITQRTPPPRIFKKNHLAGADSLRESVRSSTSTCSTSLRKRGRGKPIDDRSQARIEHWMMAIQFNHLVNPEKYIFSGSEDGSLSEPEQTYSPSTFSTVGGDEAASCCYSIIPLLAS